MQKEFGLPRLICACLVVVSVLGASFAPATARETYQAFVTRMLAAPPAGAAVETDIEGAILSATNSYRIKKGLKPLQRDHTRLTDAARAQAMDLLATGTMGHASSTGFGFESRMRALHPGQMFLPAMAENAARQRKPGLSDMAKAADIVQQWINSSGHRKNLASRSYVTVAIGAVKRGDEVYAVQIFSGPDVRTNMNLNIQN